MRTAFTLPLLIRKDEQYVNSDLTLLDMFAYSLKDCEDYILIIYNQGFLTSAEIKERFSTNGINCDVIGDGVNVGIPISRQKMFEYVWEEYPEVEYISELHLDMIFTKNWHIPVIEWLDKNQDEPMCSPAIISAFNHYYMDPDMKFDLNKTYTELIDFLTSLSVDKVIEGLVHPAIHRSSLLKTIGGIDTRFFKSIQGYEDYSILIGYRYWVGLKNNWKPKIYGKSTVYHAVAQQRWTLGNVQNDIAINGEGLFYQYGSYGLKELSLMLDDEEYMGEMYRQRVNYFVKANLVPNIPNEE